MTSNFLFKLREWLTVNEAAEHLSALTEEPVSNADVLRLALDGHLRLAVYLPQNTSADCWELPELPYVIEEDESKVQAFVPEDADYQRDYWRVPAITQPRSIQDVWDLPLIPPASLLVESQFNEQRGLPKLAAKGMSILVERPSTAERPGSRCRLRPVDGQHGSLPTGGVLCVRTAVINEFIFTHSNSFDEAPEKSVSTKEQNTLVIIIAALAKAVDIPVNETSKAGGVIEELTISLGAKVAANTIAGYLKKIPKAIAARSKKS